MDIKLPNPGSNSIYQKKKKKKKVLGFHIRWNLQGHIMIQEEKYQFISVLPVHIEEKRGKKENESCQVFF